MKRILFVTKNMGLGGAEKHIVDLSNGLCEKGFKIAIFVFDTKGNKGFRIKDINPEIQIISPREDYGKPSLLMGSREVIKASRKWKPDVLCSMLWNTKFMTAIAGRLLGTSTVLVVSNSPVYETSRKKHKSLSVFYRKIAYSLADAVVAVSRDLAQETKELYRLNEVKAVCNGIDIEGVRAKSNQNEGEVPHEYFETGLPVLVATGGLREQKGFKYLIEAFAAVNETTEALLIIVGDGPLKEELLQTAKSLKIDHKIAMVGEKEPYLYMKCGDIFVHSSIYEGFPIVLLEATSLGRPIIATNCDHGPRELIKDGESGLLVPVADPVRLASAILRLINDEKLRSDLSAGAEKRARCFTRERMVCGYEEIFISL